MRLSNTFSWSLCCVGVVAAALVFPALSGRAHAFGGVWSSQAAAVEQSGEAILFVDNPDSTVTAVVQINYAGPAQQFAWLIPVPGKPTVGVSSSTVFQRLDAATAPQYWVEVTVEGMCKQQEAPDAAMDTGTDAGIAPSTFDTTAAPVTVIEQNSVGPYDYVTISADPTLDDPTKAATDWLASNGYELTDLDSEVLSPYLRDGLNLLAFKLSKGKDAGAIRPVSLTYESKLPMIPLRPAAVAAQDDVGIQVWVIGPSQAVPANYKSLVINDALFDWLSGRKFATGTLPSGGAGPSDPDYAIKPSNYAAVVSAAADEAGGQGFVTELGAPASQFREKVWSPLDDGQFAMLSNRSYEDGIDAIVAANGYYGGWDGWREAVAGATTLPDGVTLEELGRDPEQYRGMAKVDSAKFFQLLDANVIRPVADTAALFYRAPYLTRLYSTMSAQEMTLDPIFTYNFDLAQVSNIHIARQFIACSPTKEQGDAPWRMELPQGGVVAGKGSDGWPVAIGSMPANLEVVQLSTRGSGNLIEDNSHDIATKLGAGTVGSGMATLQPPQNGVLIGGTQTVKPYVQPAAHGSSDPAAGDLNPSGGKCSVAHLGADTGAGPAFWLPLAALALASRRRRSRAQLAAASLCAVLSLAGCENGDAAAPARGDAGSATPSGTLTREQLRDPETCKDCHPTHYREWASSMHAYAAQDPVFVAMNKRGQRETGGELGEFCVKCHAPMAVVDKLTKDGLNLEQLADRERGVSCYFCHNVTGIDGDHNAMLHQANDTSMRGPIHDPLQPGVHRAEFSEIFENTNPKSNAMCGGCHDIVTPAGVHLERTLQEYRSGIFSKSATGAPPSFDGCMGCHMPGRKALVAVQSVVEHTLHDHLWPGIDVPLTDFPNRDAMRSAVEDCQLGAPSVSFFTLEVTPPDLFTFQIETNAGHNQPSGAAQDRRMWLEFSAYDASGKRLDEVSSGNIADGEIEDKPTDDPKRDPHLLMFRDHIYDAQGKPVHMFWEAASSKAHPDGYESNVLPVASTTYIEGRHAVVKQYRASGPDGLPARVTARLRVRPIGLDVLQDLVESGDLDPTIVARMPTLTLGAQIEWTKESGLMKTVSAKPNAPDCSTYRCMLDPGAPECR